MFIEIFYAVLGMFTFSMRMSFAPIKIDRSLLRQFVHLHFEEGRYDHHNEVSHRRYELLSNHRRFGSMWSSFVKIEACTCWSKIVIFQLESTFHVFHILAFRLTWSFGHKRLKPVYWAFEILVSTSCDGFWSMSWRCTKHSRYFVIVMFVD